MSHTAQDWAWDQECSGIASHVLVFLAWCHNRHNGLCCPGIEYIIKKTRHTERAVRKAIAELIGLGLITRHERRTKEGRITSPQYVLACSSAEIPIKPNGSGSYPHGYPQGYPQSCPQTMKKNNQAKPNSYESYPQGYPQTYPQNAPAPANEQVLNPVPAPANEQVLKRSSPCENDSPAPANSHPEPGTKEKKKEKGAYADLEGKQASKAAREGERDPTPAEVIAQRRAAEADLSSLPSEMAAAFRRVLGLGQKAYAPGCHVPDRDTQIERLNHKPAVTARPLSPEHLAIVRARSRGAACQQAYA